MLTCVDCREIKPDTDYPKDGKGRRRRRCRTCFRRRDAATKRNSRGTLSGWWEIENSTIGDDGQLLELERLPDVVLCFGDTQAPLHHPDALAFIEAVINYYKPTFTVFMGDELDLTSLKKHMLSADSPGPEEEIKTGIEFMRGVFDLVPQAVCLTSNHVAARIGYAQAQGNIPTMMLKTWPEVLGAPQGWVWRDYLVMGNYVFEHGHLISKGARASIQEDVVMRFGRTMSVVRGHHHGNLGDHIKPIWVQGHWQQRIVYTGCLMDKRKVGYSRAALALGCVVIVKGVPHAVPMIVDRHGKWIGKLVH